MIALMANGKVAIWGQRANGGCVGASEYAYRSCMPEGLTNVETIFARRGTYAALHKDGT